MPRQAKLNVLLTVDRPHAPEHWTVQLPRLLEPQGVVSYVAQSGHEAIDFAESVQFHAAVIDMGTPWSCGDSFPTPVGAFDKGGPAGLWLLELWRRLPDRPPVVVIGGPAISQRQLERLLREALRLGVFSVVNKPINLEKILAVFRRLLDRQYRGYWPPQSH